MDDKRINLDASVHDTVEAFPEVKDIMVELGFSEIVKPGMLDTMGRIMTLRTGSAAKGVDVGRMAAAFQEHGFAVDGYDDAIAQPDAPRTDSAQEPAPDLETPEGRQQRLEQLVRRLSAGEDLESVRAEFVAEFASVSAEEIAQAEQNLITGGMPVSEVQQLCDVHSALFHGRTEDEVCHVAGSDGLPAGHPVNVLKRENDALLAALDRLEAELTQSAAAAQVKPALEQLKGIKSHYGKKEELLMPLLYDYGFTGPSDVMWGVDDEIVHELGAICRSLTEDAYAELLPRITALTARMREMVYKEEQIFLPLCLEHLTNEEWLAAYRDLEEFGWAFISRPPRWLEGDVWVASQPAPASDALENGKIQLPTGEVSVRELTAILKLLPLDLTFIDADERTRFFTNEGKVFARPLSCLGREVWSCHPPQLVPMIKGMLAEFKAKTRTYVERWIPNPANPVRVVYAAVYDDEGVYIGTLEMVQQFSDLVPKLDEIIAAQPR